MLRSIELNRTTRKHVHNSMSQTRERTKSVHAKDGAFGFQVEARGTVRVVGATWRYMRGAHFVIASNRIEFSRNGPPYDDQSNRAIVDSYITTETTDVAFSGDGKKIKAIERVIFRQFDDDTSVVKPFSFGDDTPYDGRMLSMLRCFVRDEERVVVLRGGCAGEEWVRFETPNTRMVVMRLSGYPTIVVGDTLNDVDDDASRIVVDADRLANDRKYALSFVSRFARSAIDAVSGNKAAYDACRSGSVSDLILHLANVVDENGKTELGMVLREAAYASESHGVTWSEIDAAGVSQCN